MRRRNSILNIQIDSLSRNELLSALTHGVLFTPNVDHIVRLQKDAEFFRAYQQADWVICDSKILSLAAKFLHKPFEEVIPGSTFFTEYYTYHRNNPDIKIFLLGSAEGVADIARERINQKVGREIVVGAHAPSFHFEDDEHESQQIIDIINRSGANVLVVGCGAPKQEKWIVQYKSRLRRVKTIMALGATIDYEANTKKRAPMIFRQLNLEWFYRLVKEPRRLWKRYLVHDMFFFILIIREKFSLYKSPFISQHIGNKKQPLLQVEVALEK